MAMFSFIKQSLQKIYSNVTSRLSTLFQRRSIDAATFQELQKILLSADTGAPTTKKIITTLQQQYQNGMIQEGSSLQTALKHLLLSILETQPCSSSMSTKQIIILVGINGSGKTTFAAKLAHQYKKEGKQVLLIAADTFRAAASEQLALWAQRIGIDIVQGKEGQDPASIVFAGCQRFKKERYDKVIIDTAGRLHTKVNLMHELAKIKRVIAKQISDELIATILIIDSMLGQNSFEQAKLFKECTSVDGIALTKMDGSAKGGIVFSIIDELAIPIWYITYGETVAQLKVFNNQDYVENLLQS